MAAVTLAVTTPLHANTYEALIQEAAEAHKVDAALIRAVMRAESAFNPLAVSSAGALGLMQLMPALAAEMGVQNPFDPRENTMGGARYLKQLLRLHRGNVPLALASYNAGPGAVKRYGNQIPPFKETRNYVTKITEFLKQRNRHRLPVSAVRSPIRRSTETIDGRTIAKYSNVP